EAPDDGGAGARTDAGDDRERLHAATPRLARTKSSRSLPKNISSPTYMVGAPKTPRDAASSVAASSALSSSGSSMRARRFGASTPAPLRTAMTSAVVDSGAPVPQ